MPPITLTRAQFAQTPASAKPGASYGNYLAFIAARRGANKAAPAPAAGGGAMPGPLDPWTPGQITAITNRITGAYGTPQTPAQIKTTAQSEIDPIIAALTKSATDRATGASAAIKSLTDSYAAQLGAENFAAPYQTAETGQAAVDAALQQSLAGAGSGLAADLSKRLGAINDPSVAAAASGLADRGAALGTTQLASGSSALSELIANAASAGEYGLKQPVLAREAGIQGTAQAQAQATNEIATGTQSALSQLPQIVQALEASNAQLRGNRADAAANVFSTLTGQNITKASLRAGLTGSLARADATVTAAQTRAAASSAAASARVAAAASKPSSSVTRMINDGYLHNADSSRTIRNGQPVKVAPSGSKTAAGFTPAQVARYHGQAVTILGDSLHGYDVTSGTGANRTTTRAPGVSFKEAKNRLDRAGVPASVYLPLLNAAYPPGFRGRPFTPAQAKAQRDAAAHAIPTLPFDQLQAMAQAGK